MDLRELNMGWSPTMLSRVIGWLRQGYPQGVPERDYIPLIAVLARRLSAEEVLAVARQLQQDGQLPPDDADIGTLILKITDELPSQEDVARVRSQLALAGWPLADPHNED
jgi:hypothetical protein